MQKVARAYDACIIGSGPGGATAAYALGHAGKSVLLLEQGRILDRNLTFEQTQADRERTATSNTFNEPAVEGDPWSASSLGGGMTFFAGIAFRYRRVDFDARKYIAGDALDPKWPIDYDDLRQYYDDIERLIGVARAHCADPMEPACSPPPMPPHPYSIGGQIIAEASQSLGLQPYPTPLAINSVQYLGFPSCQGLTPCTEHQCPIGAKADVITRVLRPLLSEPRAIDIKTRAAALRILQENRSRVAGVEWLDMDTHTRAIASSRVIIVAANAVQSAALLLRSRNRDAPRGLGNDHDLVGRGLSFKVRGYVSASLKRRALLDPDNDRGPHSTVALSDFYVDPNCPSGLGGIVYEARSPTFGTAAARVLRLHFLAADQPMRENRVTLQTAVNALGQPRLLFEYTPHRLDLQRKTYLARRAGDILRSAGGEKITEDLVRDGIGGGHLHGTCRAGKDPHSSVVNADGRVHGIDNLYVVDGAYMPYAGGVNPTLTIQANALRIATKVARAL
jgi:choline dehydrogenase-like flavoprotein